MNSDADKQASPFAFWPAAFRFSSVKLLIALIIYIGAAPFVDQFHRGQLISSLCITAVMITATMAMGNRRWTLIVAIFLVIPTLLARWSVHVWPEAIPPEIFSVSGMLFAGFVVGNILWFILRAPEVDSEVLCAGVSGYLLIGLFWAFAYTLVGAVNTNAFWFQIKPDSLRPMQSFTAIYFSYITLSSVGYGDIAPVSPAARMLAMMEAMTGLFYVTVMIARLVALYSTRERRR
jgi:hypothetical protein